MISIIEDANAITSDSKMPAEITSPDSKTGFSRITQTGSDIHAIHTVPDDDNQNSKVRLIHPKNFSLYKFWKVRLDVCIYN